MIISYNAHFDGFEIYDGLDFGNNGTISNAYALTRGISDYRFSVRAELAIYDWISHAMNCDGREWNASVIWDKPGKDRPSKPYITLDITSGPTTVGKVDIKYNGLDAYSYTYRKTITLAINVIAENGYLYHINKILNSFYKECCYVYLKRAGLVYWRHYGPFDSSELLDAEFEFRASADIILAFGHTEIVKSGEIHKVKVNDWPDIEI